QRLAHRVARRIPLGRQSQVGHGALKIPALLKVVGKFGGDFIYPVGAGSFQLLANATVQADAPFGSNALIENIPEESVSKFICAADSAGRAVRLRAADEQATPRHVLTARFGGGLR